MTAIDLFLVVYRDPARTTSRPAVELRKSCNNMTLLSA
jgi:hypothetical protein